MMYIPKYFKKEDKNEIINFLKEYCFGTIVSYDSGKYYSSNIPFIVEQNDAGELELYFHLAKANLHYKILDNQNVVINFVGPNTYIPSKAYNIKGAIPTWNYVSVEIKGEVNMLDEIFDKINVLIKTIKTFESDNLDCCNPYDKQNIKFLDEIIAGKVIVKELNAKWKLGQNHPESSLNSVIEYLKNQKNNSSDLIADYMQKEINNKK